MSQFNRPLIPFWYDDAHQSGVIDSANDNNIRAGKGITLTKTTFGTTIAVKDGGNQTSLNFRGTYNYSASYSVGDIVWVDPNTTILDYQGNPLPFQTLASSSIVPTSSIGCDVSFFPPICPGLFVCVNPVPPIGVDNELLSSVEDVYAAAGQQVTTDVAADFRFYGYNAYYPFYPGIPPSYLMYTASGAGYDNVANQTYWAALAPYFPGGSSSAIQKMTVVNLKDNYLMATSSIGLVPVALPPLLQRQSYDGLTIAMPDGFHVYSYVSPGVRMDNYATASIWPPYTASGAQSPGLINSSSFSTIYATQPNGGTGVTSGSVAVSWQDITPGRDWILSVYYCSSSVSTYVGVTSGPSTTPITGDA